MYCGNPWLLFNLEQHKFALPIRFSQQVINYSNVKPLASAYNYLKGAITFNGQSVPLIDLRCLLNLPSSARKVDELIIMLRTHRDMYLNWGGQLMRLIENGIQVDSPPDLRKIDYAKWCNSVAPNNDVLEILRQISFPARSLSHTIGNLNYLLQIGDTRRAREFAGWMKERQVQLILNTIDKAIALLAGEEEYSALIVKYGDLVFALNVDSIDSMEEKTENQAKEESLTSAQAEQPIYLLDVTELAQCCHLACPS